MLAIPDPLIAANASGTNAASGCIRFGDCWMSSPRNRATPAASIAFPKQVAVTIRLITFVNP